MTITTSGAYNAVSVWTRQPRGRWHLDRAGEWLTPAGQLLAPAGGCSAAFAVELGADPNRMSGADVIELAELIAGPVPDYTHRRHAA